MEIEDKVRSCANCKNLSDPATVKFNGGPEETRVICLRNHWKGSAMLWTVAKNHPHRYALIADECEDFATKTFATGGARDCNPKN